MRLKTPDLGKEGCGCMSRISCNVTKDLLSSYLDEICSGESRELVEEHLKECPSCREFLVKLQEQDVGKDGPRVAYLKKVRHFIDIQSLVGIFLPLLMLLGGFYGVNRSSGSGIFYYFYYVEMPVMMLLWAYILGRGRETGLPSGKEWLVPVSGLAAVCLAAIMRYLMVNRVLAWIEGEAEAPIPLENVGPFLHDVCLLLALSMAVLLTVLVVLAKKKNRFFPVSQNLAWLALNMTLSLDEPLYGMSTAEALRSYMAKDSIILVSEFAVVTVLLIVLRRAGLMKRVEI